MQNYIGAWLDDYADSMDISLYCMEPRSVYDFAIVGIADDKVVYDRKMVLSILMRDMDLEDAQEFHYTQQEALGLFSFLDRPPSILDDEALNGMPLEDIEDAIGSMFDMPSIHEGIDALEKIEGQAQDVDTSLN